MELSTEYLKTVHVLRHDKKGGWLEPPERGRDAD